MPPISLRNFEIPPWTRFQTYPRLIGDCDQFTIHLLPTFAFLFQTYPRLIGDCDLARRCRRQTLHACHQVSNLSSANRGLRQNHTMSLGLSRPWRTNWFQTYPRLIGDCDALIVVNSLMLPSLKYACFKPILG